MEVNTIAMEYQKKIQKAYNQILELLTTLECASNQEILNNLECYRDWLNEALGLLEG